MSRVCDRGEGIARRREVAHCLLGSLLVPYLHSKVDEVEITVGTFNYSKVSKQWTSCLLSICIQTVPSIGFIVELVRFISATYSILPSSSIPG